MLTLVTGGSASGKSEYAEAEAASRGGRLWYLATMMPMGENDGEFQARVARHHALRAGKGFETLECYTGLAGIASRFGPGDTVLLECLSNLAANELYSPQGQGTAAGARRAVGEGLDALRRRAGNLVVVSIEAFSDGVDYDPSTMQYLDLLGTLNRELAAQAHRVVEVVYGIPIFHKQPGGERA